MHTTEEEFHARCLPTKALVKQQEDNIKWHSSHTPKRVTAGRPLAHAQREAANSITTTFPPTEGAPPGSSVVISDNYPSTLPLHTHTKPEWKMEC